MKSNFGSFLKEFLKKKTFLGSRSNFENLASVFAKNNKNNRSLMPKLLFKRMP
jgi:hypothetical protein